MADEPSPLAAVRGRVERRIERLAGRRGPGSGGAAHGKRAAQARPALIDTAGFELAVVAVMKDELAYIEEWLCHHIAVGVQHFFLYDNGSTDGVERILDGYIDRGLVTTVRFPMRGLQRDAYNHALRLFGSASEWLAYVDIDEFLVPARDESVPAVLRRFPGASQVLVSRKEFCFSGHRTRPAGLVTEAYRLASRDVPRVGKADILAKTIIRPRGVWRMGVHSADTIDRATVNTAGEPSPEGRPAIANPTFENLQINHYYTKSWEEFSAKLARANTSTHAYQLPEVPFDIPGEPDHVVDRWIPRTKAILEEMRALSARPYRYGSHLALPEFPRSDQFRAQAASLISNEIAGLERPRKQRAFDPLPMPGVRGAVARAEDHGYESAPGRLLRSVHAQLQIRWLEGEVAWSAVDPDAKASLTADAPVTITELGPPLRQHALLFAIAVPDPARIEVGVRVPGGSWEPAVALPLELAGTYLGFVALDDAARTLEAVQVVVDGATSVEIDDLALIAYG